ncbi:MAG: hypothetical protein PUB77_02885 [Clostridiales bacterium]|nr:hypothetical protein [Clostridiales bacterium]
MKHKYCCKMTEYRSGKRCRVHMGGQTFDCPGQLVYYAAAEELLGTVTCDGGNSFVRISCCSRFGAGLPEAASRLSSPLVV